MGLLIRQAPESCVRLARPQVRVELSAFCLMAAPICCMLAQTSRAMRDRSAAMPGSTMPMNTTIPTSKKTTRANPGINHIPIHMCCLLGLRSPWFMGTNCHWFLPSSQSSMKPSSSEGGAVCLNTSAVELYQSFSVEKAWETRGASALL